MRLEARDISFKYGKGTRQILDHVNLTVEPGESVGIMAPSGYGKTTLCKILAGYERPDEGSVFLDGKPLSEYGGYCPVQLIWQHPEEALNPRLKMKHALKQGGGVSPRIAEGLGIQDEWLERYPSELSGGEMQRFCIARALGEQTKFLLADEITSMLDMITQSQIWNFLIEETERRQIGMLVVSHSKPLLARICSRVIQPG